MYIKKIVISNFRNTDKNIVWELDKDANCLVGYNGSGKSTILKIIREAISDSLDATLNYSYLESLSSACEIHFSNAGSLVLSYQNGTGSREYRNLSKEDFDNLKKIYVNTFENESFAESDDKKMKELITIQDGEFIKTNLDIDLLKLKERFRKYKNQIDNTIIQLVKSGERKFELKQYYEDFDNIVSIIDHLFAETSKTFDTSQDNMPFRLVDRNISWTSLSSGEKQLIILLLNTFLEKENPTILLLDEPEISLHLSWQQQLIELLKKVNPNCQMIIVTHSPTMFRHHQDSWKRVESIQQENSTTSTVIENSSNIGNDKIKRLKTRIDDITKSQNYNEITKSYQFNLLIKDEDSFTIAECEKLLSFIKDKITPDIITFSTLAGRLNSFEEAQQCFEILKKDYSKVISINDIFLNSLLKKATFSQGIEFINENKNPDLKFPEIITFSILLGKTRIRKEILDLEKLRDYYGVIPNNQYISKLKTKYNGRV